MGRAGAFPLDAHPDPTKPLNTLFVGGGSYTFPRYVANQYPRSSMLVMEIDPAVTRAAHEALFLPRDTPIVTRWGDGRNTVDQLIAERRRDPSVKPFDFIFGDAFNDFSVPWHLTTREFNEKIEQLLAPDGVYMINIIDEFRSAKFLGTYVQTARQTFPGVAVLVTDDEEGENGELLPKRSTFVIAMSRRPIDWTALGSRPFERRFRWTQLTPQHLETATSRSGNRTLSDDYAPVENFLAEVARNR
jgi:spermidine synthase